MDQKRLYFQSWTKVLHYIWSKNTGDLFLVCLKKMDFTFELVFSSSPLGLHVCLDLGWQGNKIVNEFIRQFHKFCNQECTNSFYESEHYQYTGINKQTQFCKKFVKLSDEFVSCEFHFFREKHLVHQMKHLILNLRILNFIHGNFSTGATITQFLSKNDKN